MGDKSNDIGEKLDDFEILENLGKDKKNITIAKVRSIKDKNIYCMRKIKIKDCESFDDKKFKNIKEKLNEINNPHVTKYYQAFKDEEYIYFIMEYIDTDLFDFIETYKITGQKVPEEIIYFLLLQCLSAIKYLNSHEFYENGFRIANILMPNERSIKIGIIKDKLYEGSNLKKDLEIIYKYFVLMISLILKEKEKKNILAYDPQFDNNDYDPKLNQIIKDLKNGNGLEEIFKDAGKYFSERYNLENEDKNSSIKSVFKYFAKNEKIKDKLSKQINSTDLYMLNLFKHIIEEKDEYFPSIEEFKRFITFEYPLFEINKEYNPYDIINFVLKKLEPFTIQEDKNIDKKEKINISDFFSIIKKVEKTCTICKKEETSYETDNVVVFDLTGDNENSFDLIKDGFNKKHSRNSNNYCQSCFTKREFDEDIFYNSFNDFIIIYLNRGKEYNNKRSINLKEKIDFNSESKDSYQLFGAIIKEKDKENFNFCQLEKEKNEWIIDKGQQKLKINIKEENKNGNLIILFYEKIEN